MPHTGKTFLAKSIKIKLGCLKFLSMPLPITIAVHAVFVVLFLCGKDAVTGQSFAHRRQWIEDKLLELATVFAIDLCAYAVMHNHFPVDLFIDKSKADNWGVLEVVERWHLLFSGTLYSQRFAQGE
jgi:hypothetical protein